ncbi:hypothetical protein HK105_207824 [Polyrhizophydium stewartii]|uniref:Uncharacterized protein n=1 Tax=Polyrhizophydium stewartii TaxID=2732419 RepID=A0ABR4MZL5_9FUNG
MLASLKLLDQIADELSQLFACSAVAGNARRTLLNELQASIKQGELLLALDLFDKIEVESPRMLSRLTSNGFGDLISLVAHGDAPRPVSDASVRLRIAKRISDVAKDMGMTLGSDVLCTLLELHTNAGNAAGVDDVLAKMQARRMSVDPHEALAAKCRACLIGGRMNEGMEIWGRLAESDKSPFPLKHLAETHIMRRDFGSTMRTLEELAQAHPTAHLSRPLLLQLCEMLLVEDNLDDAVRLFELSEASGILQASRFCAQIACRLALTGRFEDTLGVLDMRRDSSADWSTALTCAGIIALDGLGKVDQALALFPRIRRFRSDAKHALRAAEILVKHVGPVDSDAQLESLLASHGVLAQLSNHAALVMLLRGYIAKADLVSARFVFEELLLRPLEIPSSDLTRLVVAVLNAAGPQAAINVLSMVAKAGFPIMDRKELVFLSAIPIWDSFPNYRDRIKMVHPFLMGLAERHEFTMNTGMQYRTE